MPFTQRQRLVAGEWRRALAVLAVGLLLGFAGPFGSYPAFPTATRYAFWLGLTVVGALAAIAASALVPPRWAGAVRIGAVALLSALPMTFVVAWTMSLLQPGRDYAPVQLLGLFWGVAAVQLVVAYAVMRTAPALDPPETAIAEPRGETVDGDPRPAAFPSALLNKLPPEIGSNIVALETEDHYLRVHGAGRSALILMRMADAVAMLDPRLGTQVHRRWWVAEAAVAGAQTEGARLALRLTDGTMVPVGRTFAAAARARFARGQQGPARDGTQLD